MEAFANHCVLTRRNLDSSGKPLCRACRSTRATRCQFHLTADYYKKLDIFCMYPKNFITIKWSSFWKQSIFFTLAILHVQREGLVWDENGRSSHFTTYERSTSTGAGKIFTLGALKKLCVKFLHNFGPLFPLIEHVLFEWPLRSQFIKEILSLKRLRYSY